MKHAAAMLGLSLVISGACAQPVYRCGSTYSQSPCLQGTVVDVSDPRSAAQRAEALRVAADERRLAAALQRDRLADQAMRQPALAGSLSGPAAPTAKPPAPHKAPLARKKRSRNPVEGATDAMLVAPSRAPQRSDDR